MVINARGERLDHFCRVFAVYRFEGETDEHLEARLLRDVLEKGGTLW